MPARLQRIVPRTGKRPLLERLKSWLQLHAAKLKWLHSLWALALGIGIMLFFRQNFGYIRVIVAYLAFIWVASLVLYRGAERFGITAEKRPRLRNLVLYIVQNFYHEMLFFLIPFYYASTTFSSGNVLFLLLIAACAVIASFDMVYWRWLTHPSWHARIFYAVIVFACFNVFLPVIFGIRNAIGLYIAGLAAAMAFASLDRHPRQWFTLAGAGNVVLAAAVSLCLVFLLRRFIPPCPLQLAGVDFGRSFDRAQIAVSRPIRSIQELAGAARIYAVARLKAPLGVRERVSATWYADGRKLGEGRAVEIHGGRKEGYRLWSAWTTRPGTADYRLEIWTEGGQLIGRAKLSNDP